MPRFFFFFSSPGYRPLRVPDLRHPSLPVHPVHVEEGSGDKGPLHRRNHSHVQAVGLWRQQRVRRTDNFRRSLRSERRSDSRSGCDVFLRRDERREKQEKYVYIVVPSVECSRESSYLRLTFLFGIFLVISFETRAGLSWARRSGIQRSLEL